MAKEDGRIAGYPAFDIIVEHAGMRKIPRTFMQGFSANDRVVTPEMQNDADRCVGAAIRNLIEEWDSLVLFDMRIRDAFDGIAQKDGPRRDRFNDIYNGEFATRCRYQTFGWKHANPANIVGRFEELARQIMDSGRSIVWRRRPGTLIKSDDGKLYAYCQFHVLPYVTLPGDWVNGESVPEA